MGQEGLAEAANGFAGLNERLREMIIDFTAGSVGGIACVLTGQPLDTIKVRLQTYPKQYINTLHCSKLLWKEGYIRPFYYGAVPAIACNLAENSILFLAYGQCLNAISYICGQKPNNLHVLQNATAGSLASFFSSLALCPLELVKCRLQTAKDSGAGGKRISSTSIVRDVVKAHGLLGMYKGFSMTLAREMPGYFFLFGGYEGSRKAMLSLFPEKKAEDASVVLFAGGMSGISFWGSIYPTDVIKTRQQVLSQTGADLSFMKILRQIIAEQGLRGLYTGVTPCILRAFPANAALFLGYETTKSLFA